MRRVLLLLSAGLAMGVAVRGQESKPAGGGAVRFTWLDVYVDSGSVPLAAYQVQLRATAGHVAIVGIEGGEHAAYSEPPYYDPAALQQDRIIIAAFNTGKDLPAGKTRVARVHLQFTGVQKPEYDVQLDTAANAEGGRIPVVVTFAEGDAK